MRRFRDAEGREWDVVLGRESWGSLLALFVPVGGGAVMQAPLRSAGYDSAQHELDTMDEATLHELLRGATEKEG
ncbi:MAG: hypothetical protein GX539_01210 [Candidatus Cloacimonetes bacterium]|jgi:hypothetical protein|nr:hypothetical protein [Candidatus Cloacimonadota bacterium]